MVTVQEPANDALGVATTKEVEVLLEFEGVFSGKMLYGKKPLKGSAAHIDLYDAYGITPRKYEFADGLDAAATLPFFDVVGGKKKKYVFCAVAVDTQSNVAVALLFDIAASALVEKDLATLQKGASAKDGKHLKAAASALEVRRCACCVRVVVVRRVVLLVRAVDLVL